jgi:dihydrofolate reductase
MSRVRVYIACSLDGFIAGPGDDLSWLEGPQEGDGAQEEAQGGLSYEDFMAQVGVLLMGRRTFDVVDGFDIPWPYEKPVLVATHRELRPPAPLVRAVSGDLGALLAQARREAGGKDIYLDGGALIREATERGLVDEYVITLAPVLLGRGVPLFAGLEQRQRLKILEHHSFGAGMVQLRAVLADS